MLSDDPRFEVVGEAVDGRSSLEQLVGTKPDVLLLDVNMPGGGPDVARAAKHLRPATRILVFTALGSAQIRRDMVDAGADAFLVKTGRLRPLLDALSEITTCR